MNRVPVEPALLRWARERSGRSVESLANRFPKLAAWERRERQPTLKQLEAFARATYTPIGYLFLGEPPVERVPIPDFRRVSGMEPAPPSPDLLDTLYLCQQRQDWYRDFARSMGDAPLAFVGSATASADVVGTAARMREALGLDTGESRAADLDRRAAPLHHPGGRARRPGDGERRGRKGRGGAPRPPRRDPRGERCGWQPA